MRKKSSEQSQVSGQYAHWLRTRKYYLRAPAMNMLARMQPYKSREAPSSFNWSFMQAYNAAVHTMAEQPEEQEIYQAWYLYWIIGAVTKDATRILECGTRTYYDRINRFEQRAMSLANSLHKVIKRNNEGLDARIRETLGITDSNLPLHRAEAMYG